ncbi:MAG: YbjN domain-containing protein, partial [Treponema sp.]|nr:YbjN domain-containing protein [Treponema sp.]
MADEKIEQYLINLMVTYREIDKNLWLVEDEENYLEEVAIMRADPLVVMRAAVMDAPEENKEEFFALLLKLNATDLVHGAYALDQGKVILIDTLEYDTMDLQEFRASLDAFSLALSQHY